MTCLLEDHSKCFFSNRFSMVHYSTMELIIETNCLNTGLRIGIFVTQGAEWQERRRFALKTLKEFGFGHDKMEVILQKNVQELVENFR